MEIVTTLNFLGGGHTHFEVPSFVAPVGTRQTTLSWQGLVTDANYGRHLDHLSIDAMLPGLALDGATGKGVVVRNLKFTGTFRRALGDLFVGDTAFTVDSVSGQGATSATFELDALRYMVNSTLQDGFMAMVARIGVAKVVTPSTTIAPIRYDFTLKHFDAAAMDTLERDLRASNARRTVDQWLWHPSGRRAGQRPDECSIGGL